MKKYLKFYVSFIIFIIAFVLIDVLKLQVGMFKEVNLRIILLFCFAIYLWTAQALPNSYISMLIILLIGVLKLDKFSNVVGYTFGNTIFIFLLSVVIISYAFKKSGLADRVGNSLLDNFGGSNRKILFGLMFTSYVLGMFLTGIAGVSMALPIALKIVEANNLKKGDNFAKALMLGLTYGGLIGGVATPLGAATNLLIIQYLHELGHFDLSFLHWIEIGLPLSVILLFCGYFLLIFTLKIENKVIEIEKRTAAPLTLKEKKSIIAFVLIILLFLFSTFLQTNIKGIALDMNIISVICSLIIILPPFEIIEWKDTLSNLDWESLIFLVGSVALGYVLYHTETASLIAKVFFDMTGNLNLFVYVFVFCAFTILMHILLSSNTVTGTVIVPILISFAQQMGVSPWYVVAPAVFCISLAFVLPTESPTNIVTYNTGYFEFKDMVKIGTILTIISIIVIGVFLITFGSITGLYKVG